MSDDPEMLIDEVLEAMIETWKVSPRPPSRREPPDEPAEPTPPPAPAPATAA